MSLVEVRDLTKSFHKGDNVVVPLDQVDLDMEKGDFVSLIGSSGSGKSTLLNLLAGIDQPTSGTIRVSDIEITRLSRGKLADWRAAHLGYIFQTHNLIPVLTAYENIELPLFLLPLSRIERRKRVNIALDAVGLTDRAHHYPRQLSGGQEQRVGIARAIVANPEIVVADEPTGSLDADTSLQIRAVLKQLNEELGMTLFLVTHDREMASLAGRQLMLDHGKIRELSRTRLTTSMVGE